MAISYRQRTQFSFSYSVVLRCTPILLIPLLPSNCIPYIVAARTRQHRKHSSCIVGRLYRSLHSNGRRADHRKHLTIFHSCCVLLYALPSNGCPFIVESVASGNVFTKPLTSNCRMRHNILNVLTFSVAFSPQENYTDRATAACRPS
jgi:hypothetical protein